MPSHASQAALAMDPDQDQAARLLVQLLLTGAQGQAGEAGVGLSAACAAMNETAEAVAAGQAAWSRSPGRLDAGLARRMARLRILYDDPAQIDEAREGYRRDLAALAEGVRPGGAEEIALAARTLGGLSPFCLACQNRPDAGGQRWSASSP